MTDSVDKEQNMDKFKRKVYVLGSKEPEDDGDYEIDNKKITDS